jgi:hypothetical protein
MTGRCWPPAAPWMEVAGELTLSTRRRHSRTSGIGQRAMELAYRGIDLSMVVLHTEVITFL